MSQTKETPKSVKSLNPTKSVVQTKETMKHRKYPSYKDSKSPWLGEIPEHWELERCKWLFKKEERPTRHEDEIITCFRDGTVTLRKNKRLDGFTNATYEHGYQGIRKGDLVIHQMDGFAGAIGVADSDGKSSPIYSVCTPINAVKISTYYFSYLLRSLAHIGFIASLSNGIRERSGDFRFKDFASLRLPLPPFKEQKAIAEFLDRKTQQIDCAIALKEQQIALLQEQKQIRIQQAVTRGLDAKVPLKDSGVDWIGEIPAHWEVKKLSHIATIGNGSTPSRSNMNFWNNGSIPWLNSSKVNTDLIIESDQYVTPLAVKQCHLPKVFPDTILMAITGEGKTRGMVSICGIEATINQHLAYISINKQKLLPKYLLFYFKSVYPFIRSDSSGSGSTKGAITCSAIANYKTPAPPLVEQIEIVHNIERSIELSNKSISLKQQEIQKLKEYKSTLIDSVVTGQLRVVADERVLEKTNIVKSKESSHA